MNLMTKQDELLAYFDRLNTAKANGYRCDKEISEVITSLRRELEVGIGAGVYEKVRYFDNIRSLCEDQYDDKYRNTNEIIFSLYENGSNGEIIFGRCAGVSTSLRALENTFDDVIYLSNDSRSYGIPPLNAVVFTDAGIELPRGIRYKKHIKISQVEELGLKPLQREANRVPSVKITPALPVTPTKTLCSELVSREGVEEYSIDPHGGYAQITLDNSESGDTFMVAGPAKIIVVRD